VSRTTRGTFAPGNPGRPRGARHKTTLAVENLLDGEAEELTRKAIEVAKTGDTTALRLCLERIAPVRKGALVTFTMPKVETLADVPKAAGAVLQAVAKGRVSPEEASSLMNIIESFRRSVETADLATRLDALEARLEAVRR